MKERVKHTISKYELIEKGDKIVVGVSGGHDSMTLLYVLKSLRKEMEFTIYAVHINHGIRGIEADGDEQYVRDICKKLNIPFYSHKANMDEYAKKHKLTSEEAGRHIRYSFFRKVIKEIDGNKIAVAHNKNDQAETLLMRFMRGTGVDGLRGMEYKNGNIIRPLLDLSRDDIEKYCDDNNIVPRIDKTNFETIYGRNKVRLELIPYIQKEFNSAIIDTLFRTSNIMKDDSDFLMEYTQKTYKELLQSESKSSISLNIERFDCLHKSIKTRVIRLAVEKLCGNLKGLEKKHINYITNLIESKKTGKKINLVNNIVVEISYDKLILEINEKKNDIGYNYILNMDGITYIEEINSSIKSTVQSSDDINIEYNNRFKKYFDYDKIENEIYIRNRRNGDRFTPIGMNGSKKLKDFFIDEKIPRDKRETNPLIIDGDNILWVVGLRVSEKYKVNTNTKNILTLEYIKER